MVVVGIDLAGSPRRSTGVCVLRGMTVQTRVLQDDEEILSLVREARPALVPIDAPLSLPPGRETIGDRNGEHYRPCDLELRRRGIRFFPITLGPMRALTERGLRLRAELEAMGFRVMECFPGASQDVWGIPRKQHDLEGLRSGLERLGVRGLAPEMSHDELDAVTGALTGRWYLLGRGEMLGGDDGIVVPRRERRK
jgi:predicted nuclease with RNAse H fold